MLEEQLTALRQEIQTDRIELQRTINAGFAALSEKFDEHAQQDTQRFLEVNRDVTTLKTQVNTVGRGMWGLLIAFLGAAFSWAFSILKH